MAKRLTALAIEKLKPGPKRLEIPDGDGIYFVLQPSGKRSWCSRQRFKGKPCKFTLDGHAGLKEAREWGHEIRAKLRKGIDPRDEKRAARAPVVPATDPIEGVVGKFITQHVRRNLKSPRQAERILESVVVPFFRGRRLADIRKPDVYDFRDAVRDRSGPIAANRAVSWFSSMCSWAAERAVIDANPCAGIKRPARETPRSRILSDMELVGAWLHGSLGTPYDQFFRILILTGQRRSEVAGMRWNELDFERRLWTLPASRTKNKREHTVPLSDLVVEILEAMPRIGNSDFVFTVGGRAPISTFVQMKRRIDAEMGAATPWCLHDLRRTPATGMAKLGTALSGRREDLEPRLIPLP